MKDLINNLVYLFIARLTLGQNILSLTFIEPHRETWLVCEGQFVLYGK